MKHFTSIGDASLHELTTVLDKAIELRAERRANKKNHPVLADKSIVMIFEKPSLRTRVSFEQAIYELGGHAIALGAAQVGLGKRESAADVARVLSGMVDGIVARVFEHQKLIDLAQYGSIPVINALSDHSFPCQALADCMTLMDEFGHDVAGRSLTYVGDANNVARSLAILCARLGVRFVIASPPQYSFDDQFINNLQAETSPALIERIEDPQAAVAEADAIYTDTWISMGQEDEAKKRAVAFEGFQVNADLLAAAPSHAIVMHCLPAYRGSEITDEVMEGPRSRVFTQAHNRLHGQKGLLAVLFDDDKLVA